jgi:hypothetical protein
MNRLVRNIPVSYSGQMDVIINPQRRWAAVTVGPECIRADVVRAIRMNASIDHLDRSGARCWPTSILSDPVYLPPHF